MAELIQGEQYAIGITLKQGNTPYTPSNCDDVRIMIGDLEKSYTGGGVTYNSTTNKWEFGVTAIQTMKMEANTMWQAEVKVGTTLLRTPVQKLFVASSILGLGE